MSAFDEMLNKQNQLLRSIERALPNFKKLGQAKMTIATTQNRMTILKENYNKAQDLHARLSAAVEGKMRSSLPYFADNVFEDCEEPYLEALDYMSEVFKTASANEASGREVSTSSTPPSRPTAHLPRIQLPSFDGSFEAWESFRDRFKSMVIDEKSLANVDRLHFLCSSLRGDASNVIAHLPITEKNFDVAWKLITSRYENKRRLITTHLTTLFSLPKVTSESARELGELRDRINVSTQALKNLDRPVEHWSDIIVFLGVQKLDRSSRKAWELKVENTSEFPTDAEFDTFLESRSRALEAMAPVHVASSNEIGSSKRPKQTSIVTHTTAVATITCPVCWQNHLVYRCPAFIAQSPSERYNLIKSQRRCLNCFSAKHASAQCPSRHACKDCKQRHHTLLHFPRSADQSRRASTNVNPAVASESEQTISANLVSDSPTRYGVLLSTANVQVHSPHGRRITVRALLDQGSAATLISERITQLLRLHRTRQYIRVTGIGETQSVANSTVPITFSPSSKDQPAYSTTAVILKTLTNYVPPRTRTKINWSHLSDLVLADGDPMSSDPIDLIIGADLYSQLLVGGIRKGLPATPVAQNTTLGWILSGPIASSPSSPSIAVHHCANSDQLDRTLRQFWEIEEISSGRPLSEEDQQCENHFLQTHHREADGRYVIRLPFRRASPLDLGDSRLAALRSLHRVERRLQTNSALATLYRDFMSEYEALDHMSRVPSDQLNSSVQSYYIPHHAVVRESSSSTNLRVVFNASCRSTNGQSLNDHLLPGPKLQGDLIAILLRWRQFLYVYAADVAKMYRQIKLNDQDQKYQRILWRKAPTEPVTEYQLRTVTYGTSSAPFQALRVLKQLTVDEGHRFPLATPVIQDQTYVDDCLFGANSPDLLKQTRDQLIAIFQAGGFRLRKWASNAPSLLEDIDPSDHGLASTKPISHTDTIPILGLAWIPALDRFRIRLNSPVEPTVTKRAVLSALARLFDPLGWIAPVVISAKILMQKLWAARCDWDESIPDTLQSEWQRYVDHRPDLDAIQISRPVASGPVTSRSLHGFADASSMAYAAVVYIRSVLQSGRIEVALLMAKSRVAQVKTISVPRLELSATLLLDNLLTFVRSALRDPQCETHCWTDSSIVLTWISQSPAKWKTFVANRVSHIQTRLPDAQWHHVPTQDNPADCASRGISPSHLRDHSLWWTGPAWLSEVPERWPKSNFVSNNISECEARPLSTTSLVSVPEPFELATRYSSWAKLIRVTAYVQRFINRLRSKSDGTTTKALVPTEIIRAKLHWLKTMQAETFQPELRTLAANGTVSKSSQLSSLNPYLDSQGLIRAKGRLSKAQLPVNAKEPIILRSHPLLSLLIKHTHLRHLHAGPQLTLACLRQEYWILRARATVRAVLYGCVACTREKAAVPHQLMGDLPASRTTRTERPFIHTGVDYAGPIQVRTARGRGHKAQKAYIAVFVCLVIKAIHLEVVSDYSSAAFLAAYHRFVSRRGLPRSMSSDNGTTFHGANRELSAAYRAAIHNTDLQNRLAVDQVAWHFLPPSAPHFGGLWEAAVKSVKYHLKRCIGAHTLTYEELTTFLCRVEACLNSRPIAPTSDCIDDYSALTPGHFLIGASLVAIPEPSVLSIAENRLSRWQLTQRLVENLWKAWTNDYLQTLHQRPKWKVRQVLTKVGQIVLLRNTNTPPSTWELGRIAACHPGDDGLVRVVTVKTATSIFKRPISKLCFLPVTINEASEPRGV